MMKIIETDRLLLRQFTPGDLDELHLIFSDPDVVKYMKPSVPASRQETECALDSIIRHWDRHGFGRWAVAFKRSGRLIGYGGLRNLEGMPELVYLLAKPYWRMGLATEIARACLKWGFEERGFENIIAVTRPEHAVSRRVMEKVGMTFERDARIHEIDVVLYSISREKHRTLSLLEDVPLKLVAA